MSSDTPSILVETDPPLGWLIFNRPEKLNALDLAMWEAIPKCLAQLENDPEVRVIIIKGADERAFAAGADISEFARLRTDPETGQEYDQINAEAFDSLATCSKPTIAAIEGFCIGGGTAIALNIDIRLASEEARFALTPAKLGLAYPHGGLEKAVQELGPAGARYLFLTAMQVDAAKALEIGLIQEVHPTGEVAGAAEALGRRIAELAPKTLLAIKESIVQSSAPSADRNMARVEAARRACFESEDYQEGIRAFGEKRKPKFVDR